ncbi:hypothetical protein FOA52_012698 [Chlamydomonas sp. UWO 241]|nr:hypothetical protein FOA52_012698 [Chlamydomonas sp. UWO 241]
MQAANARGQTGASVLYNERVFASHLWGHLDAHDKRTLRLVSSSMKAVMDGAVQTLDGTKMSTASFRAALTLFTGLTTLITASSCPEDLVDVNRAPLVRMKKLSVRYQSSDMADNGVIADAQAAAPAAAAEVDSMETLKVKAITKITSISRDTPEVRASIAAMIKALDEAGVQVSKPIDADDALSQLKKALTHRGVHGIISLGRMFRTMDADHDNKISYDEFRMALKEFNVEMSEQNMHKLFRYFDFDCSGYLSFDELLVGIRGKLNDRRKGMVDLAFKFMETFEAYGGGTRGDGIITADEFDRYYGALSASIDDDDYFELVIRNAWHISGGKGWCANTTCKRVLVLHNDGSQSVVEVTDDFDIDTSNVESVKAALIKQGVDDIKGVALYGLPSFSDLEAGPPASPFPSTASAGGSASTSGVTPTQVASNRKAQMTSNITFG